MTTSAQERPQPNEEMKKPAGDSAEDSLEHERRRAFLASMDSLLDRTDSFLRYAKKGLPV